MSFSAGMSPLYYRYRTVRYATNVARLCIIAPNGVIRLPPASAFRLRVALPMKKFEVYAVLRKT